MTTESNLAIKLKFNAKKTPSPTTPSSTTPRTPRPPNPPVGDLLWGRIIFALLLLLALVYALGLGVFKAFNYYSAPAASEYLLDEHPDEGDTSLDSAAMVSVEQAHIADVAVNEPPPEVVKTAPMTVAEVAAPVAAQVVNTVPVLAVQVASSASDVTPSHNNVNANVKTNIETSVKTNIAKTAPPVSATQNKNLKVAPVKLFSDAIEHAQFSLDIKDRAAVGDMPEILSYGDASLLKVYFFTRYQHLQGEWLYYDWYKNGVRTARVKSRLKTHVSDSYSSKFIDKNMFGNWQIKVVNTDEKVLAEGSFIVKP